MKKIVEISLFGIETFIDGLSLPTEFNAKLDEIRSIKLGNNAPNSVFRMVNLSNESVFHVCKFLTLRNDFDLFTGEEYFGEVRLNFLDYIEEQFKLVTVAHCRSNQIRVVSA